MALETTLIFYLVVGLSVAAAMFLTADERTTGHRLFQVTTSFLFWPLYLPILLSKNDPTSEGIASPLNPRDAMAEAIAQVESELDAALSRLDGWAEDVLARETQRIGELRAAWNTQAARIREMDQLLSQPGFNALGPDSTASNTTTDDRISQSLRTRRENIERLAAVRRRAHEELMSTLAWVRELVSMIHLAKFTGAPPSRAEELVAQIAAAVEGISQVTWRDEATAHETARGPDIDPAGHAGSRDPLAAARG